MMCILAPSEYGLPETDEIQSQVARRVSEQRFAVIRKVNDFIRMKSSIALSRNYQ